MLLVDDGTAAEESQGNSRLHGTDPFMYQHGLTPPLKHVRRRRFRKKLSKRVTYTRIFLFS